MNSNYEVALKAEMKRVVRCFQRYTHEQRANHDTLHVGVRQRKAVGEFFYIHPEVPGKAFPKRGLAAAAALSPSVRADVDIVDASQSFQNPIK